MKPSSIAAPLSSAEFRDVHRADGSGALIRERHVQYRADPRVHGAAQRAMHKLARRETLPTTVLRLTLLTLLVTLLAAWQDIRADAGSGESLQPDTRTSMV